MEKTTFILRPYTLKELAALYEVSKHTFRRWIQPYADEIGARLGKTYTMLQVVEIIKRIGFPPSMIARELQAQLELFVKSMETLSPGPVTTTR